MDVNPSAAPVQAPSEIKPESGLDVTREQVATVSGDIGGVVGGIPGGVPEAPPPPPPPPAPVRVGGAIQPPKKVRDVAPTYPPIAQSARVQGVVILEATIGPDGRVQTFASCARFRCSTRRPSRLSGNGNTRRRC